MRPKADVLQEHFGVQEVHEAGKIGNANAKLDSQLPLSAYTKLALPYEAPNHPGIPTLEEIEQSMKTSRLNHRNGYRLVVRVGNTVVKEAYDRTIVQEAEDLLWLQENTQVRVPKLYAIFSRNGDENPPYYLVMEFIEGQMLDWKTWTGLSADQRETIHSKLSEQLQLLRSVPSEGYYGRVNNQAFHPFSELVRTNGKDFHGPYKTYEDLVSAMFKTAELAAALRISSSTPENEFLPEQGPCLDKFMPTLANCNGQEPKLTHVDPNMQNWLVQPLDGTMQDASDYQVTLIDWCRCGWYPAWVQRMALDNVMKWVDLEKLAWDFAGEKQWRARVARYFDESYDKQLEYQNETRETCLYRLY